MIAHIPQPSRLKLIHALHLSVNEVPIEWRMLPGTKGSIGARFQPCEVLPSLTAMAVWPRCSSGTRWQRLEKGILGITEPGTCLGVLGFHLFHQLLEVDDLLPFFLRPKVDDGAGACSSSHSD